MLVRAKQKMYYDRREHLPGETYEMDDREYVNINVLCLLGWIEKVTDDQTSKKPEPAPAYKTAAIKPEPAPVDIEDDEKEEGAQTHQGRDATVRRYYRRRDMRPDK